MVKLRRIPMKRMSVMIVLAALLLAPSLPALAGDAPPCRANLFVSTAMCTQPQWATEGCEIWVIMDSGYSIDFYEIASDKKSLPIAIISLPVVTTEPGVI